MRSLAMLLDFWACTSIHQGSAKRVQTSSSLGTSIQHSTESEQPTYDARARRLAPNEHAAIALLLFVQEPVEGFQTLGTRGTSVSKALRMRGGYRMVPDGELAPGGTWDEVLQGSMFGGHWDKVLQGPRLLRKLVEFPQETDVLSRRSVVAVGSALFGALALDGSPLFGRQALAIDSEMYTLPPLPYAYDALEPYIDKVTLEDRRIRHREYVAQLNAQVGGLPSLNSKNTSLVTLVKDLCPAFCQGDKNLRKTIGGHYNNCLLESTIGPNGGGAPSGELAAAFKRGFGSFEEFKYNFAVSAENTFKLHGSGWTWLVVDKDGSLKIVQTESQDNPLMKNGGPIPILGIDVWPEPEYKMSKDDYIAAFFKVIHWAKVAEYYSMAVEGKPIPF